MFRAITKFPAFLLILTVSAATTSSVSTRSASSGDLTKPIEQYTGDELAALVNRVQYGQGAERSRGCHGTAECAAGQRTNVRIDAVADADSLGAGSTGAYGTIAAR